MSKHTLDDLRDALFETLAALKDKKNPMDIERAMAVKDVAQTLINSAKAEIEFIKVTGSKAASRFIPVEDTPPTAPTSLPSSLTAHGVKEVARLPGATVTTHRMRG